jgi:hypothetical protein
LRIANDAFPLAEEHFRQKLYIYVRFEVLTAVTMKTAVLWDVAPCRSAVTCSRWFPAFEFFYPEDGGDTFFRNVGSHTAPYPRRRHSSSALNLFKRVKEKIMK